MGCFPLHFLRLGGVRRGIPLWGPRKKWNTTWKRFVFPISCRGGTWLPPFHFPIALADLERGRGVPFVAFSTDKNTSPSHPFKRVRKSGVEFGWGGGGGEVFPASRQGKSTSPLFRRGELNFMGVEGGGQPHEIWLGPGEALV